MVFREIVLRELTEWFHGRGMRPGTSPGPVAVFPGTHPEPGDLTVGVNDPAFIVHITIGDVFGTHFISLDTQLDDRERAGRVTKEAVRFLQELFADRLLSWRAADGRNSGWREFGVSGTREPLVLDNRVYHLYLWSGPLGSWRAIPTILARGRIQTEREYQIIAGHLTDPTAEHFSPAERALASRLIAEYERVSDVG